MNDEKEIEITAEPEADGSAESDELAPPCNAPTQTPTENEEREPEDFDRFAEIERADIAELLRDFPHLGSINSLSEIENPARYGVLRELGLSPREAYLASCYSKKIDNRAHLHSTVPGRATSPEGGMSVGELRSARELFSGLSDSEIRSLYKRVTN